MKGVSSRLQTRNDVHLMEWRIRRQSAQWVDLGNEIPCRTAESASSCRTSPTRSGSGSHAPPPPSPLVSPQWKVWKVSTSRPSAHFPRTNSVLNGGYHIQYCFFFSKQGKERKRVSHVKFIRTRSPPLSFLRGGVSGGKGKFFKKKTRFCTYMVYVEDFLVRW